MIHFCATIVFNWEHHLIGQIIRFAVIRYVQTIFNLVYITVYKRTENTVPNRENISKIPICPRLLEVVMKFVSVGRNDHPTYRLIYS